MNNVYLTLKIGLLVTFLAACSSASEDKRYHDTMALERPPTLVVSKQEVVTPIVDAKEVTEEVTKLTEETSSEDNSVIRK